MMIDFPDIHKHNRSIKKNNEDFKLHWMLWRLSITISIVTGVSVLEILSNSRSKKSNLYAKRLFFWIACEFESYSCNSIAKAIGYNHSTILNDIKIVNNEIFNKESLFYNLLKEAMLVEPGPGYGWSI